MNSLIKEDIEIVELFLQKDENAISETAKKYAKFIFSICNGILHQRQDTEECVNTVYQKLWESVPKSKPNDLKSYIATVARRAAIDCYRTRNRTKRNVFLVSLDDYADLLVDDRSVEGEINPDDLAYFLNVFLSGLQEKERVCFVKRYYFNSSVKEIEKQTHIPRSSVYMILEKVKKELKEDLMKEGYL